MANNPMEFLKVFQNFQNIMGEMQGKLKDIRVTGSAGGDMVTVEMNGQMDVLKVSIAEEAIDPSDKEMLEDLVRAATSNAFQKVKERMREEISSASGGMNIPPGLLGL